MANTVTWIDKSGTLHVTTAEYFFKNRDKADKVISMNVDGKTVKFETRESLTRSKGWIEADKLKFKEEGGKVTLELENVREENGKLVHYTDKAIQQVGEHMKVEATKQAVAQVRQAKAQEAKFRRAAEVVLGASAIVTEELKQKYRRVKSGGVLPEEMVATGNVAIKAGKELRREVLTLVPLLEKKMEEDPAFKASVVVQTALYSPRPIEDTKIMLTKAKTEEEKWRKYHVWYQLYSEGKDVTSQEGFGKVTTSAWNIFSRPNVVSVAISSYAAGAVTGAATKALATRVSATAANILTKAAGAVGTAELGITLGAAVKSGDWDTALLTLTGTGAFMKGFSKTFPELFGGTRSRSSIVEGVKERVKLVIARDKQQAKIDEIVEAFEGGYEVKRPSVLRSEPVELKTYKAKGGVYKPTRLSITTEQKAEEMIVPKRPKSSLTAIEKESIKMRAAENLLTELEAAIERGDTTRVELLTRKIDKLIGGKKRVKRISLAQEQAIEAKYTSFGQYHDYYGGVPFRTRTIEVTVPKERMSTSVKTPREPPLWFRRPSTKGRALDVFRYFFEGPKQIEPPKTGVVIFPTLKKVRKPKVITAVREMLKVKGDLLAEATALGELARTKTTELELPIFKEKLKTKTVELPLTLTREDTTPPPPPPRDITGTITTAPPPPPPPKIKETIFPFEFGLPLGGGLVGKRRRRKLFGYHELKHKIRDLF